MGLLGFKFVVVVQDPLWVQICVVLMEVQNSLWVQIRVGGSVAAAAAEGSFVVRAMQTLLVAEIREFSGSWADSAFVGLTLIYDHRERQMFRRSEDERGKRQVYIISFCLCTSFLILCLCRNSRRLFHQNSHIAFTASAVFAAKTVQHHTSCFTGF